METKARQEEEATVERWMPVNPYTVRPDDSVTLAIMLIEEHHINQLPVVVEDRRLVGIITDRDLRDAWTLTSKNKKQTRRKNTGIASDKILVGALMTRNVVTVSPDDSLKRAAQLMRTKRIGSLPVVALTHLKGVITRSDILDAFIGRKQSKHVKRTMPARKR